MKPFDLEKAKAGHPVVTRQGRAAKIIYFGRRDTLFPIVALVDTVIEREIPMLYTKEGRYSPVARVRGETDLFMKEQIVDKWIILVKGPSYVVTAHRHVYDTPEEAQAKAEQYKNRGEAVVLKIEVEL